MGRARWNRIHRDQRDLRPRRRRRQFHPLDIEPGEIVTIDPTGLRSIRVPVEQSRRAMCSFEFIYFARPNSVMGGRLLLRSRRGISLGVGPEAPADADVVITLPNSGTPAAIGFAEESGIPFAEGMIKSRYITRTFIQPSAAAARAGATG